MESVPEIQNENNETDTVNPAILLPEMHSLVRRTGSSMRNVKVFVREGSSVDTFSTRSVSIGKILIRSKESNPQA